MKPTNVMAVAATASGLLFAACGSASASSQIIDIAAANSDGTLVSLAAGTYTIQFIDSGQGGFYDGYSPWSVNAGCDGAGMNCANGFVENLGIDLGQGVGIFNHADGFQYGLKDSPGDNHIYATGAQALASIQTGDIFAAPLAFASDPNAYVAVANPISFTLAAAQSVNFFILDYPYNDNRGGVSIQLSTPGVGGPPGVPEPAAWALMIAGFGGVGAALRRRRRALA